MGNVFHWSFERLKETGNVFHWSLEKDGQCFPLVTSKRRAMFSTGQLESERSSGRHRRQGAEQRMDEDWNNFNNDDDLEQALRNVEDVSCHENF